MSEATNEEVVQGAPPERPPAETETNATAEGNVVVEDKDDSIIDIANMEASEQPSESPDQAEVSDEETIVFGNDDDGNPDETPPAAEATIQKDEAVAKPSEPGDDQGGTGTKPTTSTAVESEVEEETTAEGEPKDTVGNSKGAQILMNRFSSLKQRANQNAHSFWSQKPALQENAKARLENAKSLWNQAPTFQTSLRTSNKPAEKLELDTALESNSKTEDKAPVTPNKEKEVVSRQSSIGTDSSIGEEEDEVSSGGDADDSEDDSGEQVDPRLRVGVALFKASAAASVVAESVATGFRGRYTSTKTTATTETPAANKGPESSKPMPESQTSLILKSRVGQHMREILDKLQPQEFAMLLGKGRLGVNLKQCYLKNHGVFVDFLVPGGQAELSTIVRTGDLPVRLGEIDLRKGTILDIPQEIAKARRPVVLILATGSKVTLERMNYIDVAVAMMHRARDYYTKRGSLSNLPSASPKKKQQPDAEGKMEDTTSDLKSVSDVQVSVADTIDSFVTPPVPTLDVRKEFWDEVWLR
jgi:hypothetical protein